MYMIMSGGGGGGRGLISRLLSLSPAPSPLLPASVGDAVEAVMEGAKHGREREKIDAATGEEWDVTVTNFSVSPCLLLLLLMLLMLPTPLALSHLSFSFSLPLSSCIPCIPPPPPLLAALAVC